MSEAIEDAEEGFYEPSKHHHMGRKLVWWNQLCEPTIDAMEGLARSLEVETPQLMCFAETCKHKKEREDFTFDALVKAHNKFAIVFAKYSEGVKEYNALVTKKDTALAQTIASFETFGAVQAEMSRAYDVDFTKFDRFDSGADKGLCGLSSCQANNLCHVSLHNRFETFVNTDTCAAIPFDAHAHACHPPPSPPPPPPSPLSPPLPPPSPSSPPARAVSIPKIDSPVSTSRINLPVTDASVPPSAVHTAGTDAWEDAEFKASETKQEVEKLTLKLEAGTKAVAEADQNVADVEEQLAAGVAAADQLKGSAAANALTSVDELRKELATAKTDAWEAHEAIASIEEDAEEAQAAYAAAADAATSAKQLVGALNNLAEAEATLDQANAARAVLRSEISEAEAVVEAAAEAKEAVESLEPALAEAKTNGASGEEIAGLEHELEEAEEAVAKTTAAAEHATALTNVLAPKLVQIQTTVNTAAAAVTTAQATVTKIENGDVVAETTDTAEEAQAAYINAANAAAAAEEVVAHLEDEIVAAETALEAASTAQAAVDDAKSDLEEAMNGGDAALVTELETTLAVTETALSETNANAVDATADASTLKAQLVAASAAAVEASAAAQEALAIVEQINAQKSAESIAGEDVHGLEALNAKWEAAEYAQAEATSAVAEVTEKIEQANESIATAESARANVDEVTAQIAEQTLIVEASAEATALVADIEDKLAVAQNTDPADESIVTSLTDSLEAAVAVVETKTAAAAVANETIAALTETLEEKTAVLVEVAPAAKTAVATIEPLETELASATAAAASATSAATAAQTAVETATAVATATAAQEEAVAAVAAIDEELVVAKTADFVDQTLVEELTDQLEVATEAAAEAEIIMSRVSDAAGVTTPETAGSGSAISDEEIAAAAAEFSETAAVDKTLTYVEETVVLTGYSLETWTAEVQAEFRETVAAIVQQVDAEVMRDDVVVETVEAYDAGANAGLGRKRSTKTTKRAKTTKKTAKKSSLGAANTANAAPIKATFAVYTADPGNVAVLLNSMPLDAFMEALVNDGLDELEQVAVYDDATVETAGVAPVLTDSELLTAEELEAAMEFQSTRDADYAADKANATSGEDDTEEATGTTTAVKITTTTTSTSTKASVVTETAVAASSVEEVKGVAAAAASAAETARTAETKAEETLASAQEAVAAATTSVKVAEAQTAVETATETLAVAQETLELATEVAKDTAGWVAAAESHVDAVDAAADVKTQIAVAHVAVTKNTEDPEAQATAKVLLVELEETLVDAETLVADTAAAVAEAKAVVIDTYVTALEQTETADEASGAMNAWEAAATELATENAFVDEVTSQLEESQRSGDTEAIVSLETQLSQAIQAQADAKVAEDNAKELVDELTSGVKAAERTEEIATAQTAVDEAKEELLDAKAVVSDVAAKIETATSGGDTELVETLEAQLQVSQQAVVVAEEAVETADTAVLTIQTSHSADIAKSIADEYASFSEEFDAEEHASAMAKLEVVVEDAAVAVDVAKKNVDTLHSKIEDIVLIAADASDPVAQKTAQAEIEKLEPKLQTAEGTFAGAVAHLEDVKQGKDQYETDALQHKASSESAIDTAAAIADAIEAKVSAETNANNPSPPSAATVNGTSGDFHYVKATDASGATRYVAIATFVEEAQHVVTEVKAKLLSQIAEEKTAATNGDAATYAKIKAQVAITKQELVTAETALEDAIALVNQHGGVTPAPVPPGANNSEVFPDKFIKVTVNGVTEYVSARAAATEARAVYDDSQEKVDELKHDLLAVLAQMTVAADGGDEKGYTSLKGDVATAKSKLRVAELHVEDAVVAFNKAAAAAPGVAAIAPGPSAHDSILRSDVTSAGKTVAYIKQALVTTLATMQKAADTKDKVAYDVLHKQVDAEKAKLHLAETRLSDAEDRLNGVYPTEHVAETVAPKVVAHKAPPAPKYQGPPAVVSVDASHVTWFPSPKGSVTGTMASASSKGTHVEIAEIQNVAKYDVVDTDGLSLRYGGDIKLPAMRDMKDEAVSVAIRLKFTHAPENGACLFHMGNGDGDAFQIKVADGVLTFQASPSLAAGGDEKMAIIAMEEDVSKFVLGREYTIVAVLGNDGYMYLFVDGDKVAEGNGMVNELNGFIRDVTMGPRRDNYVGTCHVEETVPLSAGILAVDVFDGELSDMDVAMVSGKFTVDEDFTTEPEVEI